MTQTLSFRDVEKLSAYLDGQLKPSEVARIDSRLQSEPELASALENLRQARGILRQLPQRRAPRNFTLTPKMVGQKPPLPRTYPVFRFASVLATLLLFFTFATNFMAPRMTRTEVPYGIGGGYGSGGGGDAEEPELAMEAAPEEPPIPAEAAEPAMEEAAPAEEPIAPDALAPPEPTLGAATAEDSTRAEPTLVPSEKSGVQVAPTGEFYAQQTAPEGATQAQPVSPPPVGVNLQIVLAAIAILSAITAYILRYTAIRKWRAKAK